MYKRYIFFLLLILISAAANAQSCPGGINTYPYHEGFETSTGNWVPGGVHSDWEWGTPSKPLLNSAGEGNKCWVAGTLTQSFYNFDEASWVQSPCFDFSALAHPRISFQFFCELERKYDHANIQYSVDGGTTWLLLDFQDPRCLEIGWYGGAQNDAITTTGWGGNFNLNPTPIEDTMRACLTGGATGIWEPVFHDLTFLAGLPNVTFRVGFYSGHRCNNWDGFAFDDMEISETPPSVASFAYTCKESRTVSFTATAFCTISNTWNFGDQASGDNNAAGTVVTHHFSAAGTYNVSITSNFPNSPPSTVIRQITVLDVTANTNPPILCHGDPTATLRAVASGSSGYAYTWNTNPVQTTPDITAGPGRYIVNVTAGTACPGSDTIIVTEPALLKVTPVIKPQECITDNGSIASNVSGGTAPYYYLWSNNAVTPGITDLATGDYSLQVTDQNGCVLNTGMLHVPHDNGGLMVHLPAVAPLCPGEPLTLNPGGFAFYLWQDNSVSPAYSVKEEGIYSVTVTDRKGCTATGSTLVTDCNDIYFPTAFTPNGDTKNEFFGPAGNDFSAITDYHFEIYNRMGQLIFVSTDPNKKWDGKVNGKVVSAVETFTWFATFYKGRKKELKKGTVTLIR